MFRKICKWFVLAMLVIMGWACDYEEPETGVLGGESNYNIGQQALSSNQFALPVGAGYNWEITQSWGEHCKKCDEKYPAKKDEKTYCESSHMESTTKYGWDFNLPGNADKSRSVLASADGVVKKLDTTASGNWGNYVVIDHGGNICTRYAHLLEGSITVSKGQQVCQGLKIGEIGKTGNSTGYHLHFQFEACDNLNYGIDHGFDDGNGKPMCVKSSDLYTNGVYTALKFLNTERLSCGWKDGGCGSLGGCPLASGCGNKGKPSFGDLASLDSLVSAAVGYLWQECAVSGKSDGKFHPEDKLTRAEGLKIALQTFGLAGNCKASEPFEDVKPSDWFYPYVLCGVKHGLIETIYTGFLPHWELTFSEAAKMAVESAKKAGKIEIKFPDSGHFSKDKLPITHWAYKYLETVYFYGGITSAMLNKDPYDMMTRGEYAVMVAALSPCFCSSVKCGSGCSCKQDGYYCGQNTVQTSGPVGGQTAGSGQSGGGSGGQSGQDDAGSSGTTDSGQSGSQSSDAGGQSDAGYTPPICQPYCYNKQCGTDGCGGSCGNCASGQFCNNQYGKCEYGCSLPSCASVGCECGNCALTASGCEGTSIYCGSCSSGKNCVGGKCVQACTPNCYNKQCGADGCGGSCGNCSGSSYCDNGICKAACTPNCYNKQCGADGCGGSCGYCGTGSYCENGQCKTACVPNCYGKVCGADGCGGSCGNCAWQCVNGQCMQPSPQPPAYSCDPANGYKLMVYSPGGSWQALASPNNASYSGAIPNDSSLSLKFYCSELPGAALIKGGPQGVYVWLDDKTLPNFALWSSYYGGFQINPSYNPDVVTSYFYTPTPYATLLVRVPHK